MKNLNKTLSKLQLAMGIAPPNDNSIQQTPGVDTEAVPSDVPWSIDRDTTAICCGFSEGDIIRATVCGEAAGCSDLDRQAVWAVILNRTEETPAGSSAPTIDRGVCSISGPAAQAIRNMQFSCWNAENGVDPFSSCAALTARLNRLNGLCGNRPIAAGSFTGISRDETLKALGFPQSERRKVKHYMTPDAFKKWKYICQNAKDVFIKTLESNPNFTGNFSVKCGKKTHYIAVTKCHVFISGVA